MDVALLSRLQFAFTIEFHILFPSFTIGLASWLAVVKWRWLRTGNQVYEDIYRLWVKIFAVTFGMGVVSGVVLAYQFGTNWSVFADQAGNMIGPMLAFEILTAFFLEASFLGVMLFGWNRVSPKMHFAATVIVACGTLLSAFWILSANSWMQTPQGYRVGANGHPVSHQLAGSHFQSVLSLPSRPHGGRGLLDHRLCGGRRQCLLPLAAAARCPGPGDVRHGHAHGHLCGAAAAVYR